MKSLRFFWERQLFGVCSYIGERFGISISHIRLYFIYLSFLTFGSPVFLYLVIAFWLNVRQYIRQYVNPLRGI